MTALELEPAAHSRVQHGVLPYRERFAGKCMLASVAAATVLLVVAAVAMGHTKPVTVVLTKPAALPSTGETEAADTSAPPAWTGACTEDPSRKLAFVHISRTGGTELESVLMGQWEHTLKAQVLQPWEHKLSGAAYKLGVLIAHQSSDAALPANQDSGMTASATWEAAFRFALVRNPYARLLSQFLRNFDIDCNLENPNRDTSDCCKHFLDEGMYSLGGTGADDPAVLGEEPDATVADVFKRWLEVTTAAITDNPAYTCGGEGSPPMLYGQPCPMDLAREGYEAINRQGQPGQAGPWYGGTTGQPLCSIDPERGCSVLPSHGVESQLKWLVGAPEQWRIMDTAEETIAQQPLEVTPWRLEDQLETDLYPDSGLESSPT